MAIIPKPPRHVRRSLRTAAIIGGSALAVAGAAAAGTAITARAVTRRDAKFEDPYCDLPYGTLPNAETDTIVAHDGTKLHVERAGDGPPIVFTHGFSLNACCWYHQFEHLAGEHRVVAWDIRGHGKSATSESDYALQTMAGDLEAVIAHATGNDPTVLIGHSMGGMLTAQLLVSHPHLTTGGKVKGVVFSDTGMGDILGGLGRFGSPALRAALRPLVELAYARVGADPRYVQRIRGGSQDLHYAWTRFGFGPKPSHRHVRFVSEMLAASDSDVWVQVLPSIIEMELRPHLAQIDVPALVIVGSHDRITPVPVAAAVAAALPNGELVVIEGGGHCPMLEKHDEWNRVVSDFIHGL